MVAYQECQQVITVSNINRKLQPPPKLKGWSILFRFSLMSKRWIFTIQTSIPTWFDSNDQIWTWNIAYLAHGKFARPLNFLASPLDHCSTYSHMQVKWNLCSEKLRSEFFTGKKEPSKMCGFMAQSVKAPNELLGGAGSIPSRPDVFFFQAFLQLLKLLLTSENCCFTWYSNMNHWHFRFFHPLFFCYRLRGSGKVFGTQVRRWLKMTQYCHQDGLSLFAFLYYLSVQTCLVTVYNPPLVAVGNTGGYTSHVRKEGHRS